MTAGRKDTPAGGSAEVADLCDTAEQALSGMAPLVRLVIWIEQARRVIDAVAELRAARRSLPRPARLRRHPAPECAVGRGPIRGAGHPRLPAPRPSADGAHGRRCRDGGESPRRKADDMSAGAAVQLPRRLAGAIPARLPAVVFRLPRPPSTDPRGRKPGSLAWRAWHFSRAREGVRMDDRTKRLLAKFPLPDRLSVKDAAEILGDEHWIKPLMREIGQYSAKVGQVFESVSHSATSGPLHTTDITGVIEYLPRIQDDTDPASVFVCRDDVLWRWCFEYEADIQRVASPPKEEVEARHAWLLKLAGSMTFRMERDIEPDVWSAPLIWA